MSEEISSQPVEQTTVESSETSAVSSKMETTEATETTWFAEDYKDTVESKGFKDANDVLKSYVNLEKTMGNKISIPDADASAEAKAAFLEKIKDVDGILVKPSSEDADALKEFYNKLGRPVDAEGYDFSEIITEETTQLPGMEEEVAEFKTLAHELGLTKDQAAKLAQWKITESQEQWSQIQDTANQNIESLKNLWGADYDNRVEAANVAAKHLMQKFPNELKALNDSGAGTNPAFLHMLSELSSLYKEQGVAGYQKTQFGMTPEAAISKIKDKQADPEFMAAYLNGSHPGHKKAVEEMTKLYETKHS